MMTLNKLMKVRQSAQGGIQIRTGVIRGLVLAASLLAACSIQISDATPVRPSPPVVATAIPLPPATGAPFATQSALSWSNLGLSGRLIFTEGEAGISVLDLATGAERKIFQPPAGAWLTAAAASSDGQTVVISYAPPPPHGQVQLGYTGLYIMSADGSGTPLPVLERANAQESFFTPAWSPDGQYLYFAHFQPVNDPNASNSFRYTVERMSASGGQPEPLIENAIWPRLSPDGKTLAYLSFDPVTFSNDLYIADPDGRNARPVLQPGTFVAVDAHLFSPDSGSIIFSAVGEGPGLPAEAPTASPALSWVDRLLGVRTVDAASDESLYTRLLAGRAAHNVPSDWWRISLSGGEPVRLTKIYDTSMYGGFSPDGKYVAFVASTGLYVMAPVQDGTGLVRPQPLRSLNGPAGTLQWLK
jgi:Tol biopolymer transport system component